MKKIILVLLIGLNLNLFSIELKEIIIDVSCRLSDLQFFDEQFGIATSIYGNYYITINNGEDWISKYAGTDEYLHGCFPLNKNNIWIYGSKGTLIKLDSIDGNFQDYSISPVFKVKNVYFWDEKNGILLPEAEFYFITSDGGKNWLRKSIKLDGLVRLDSYVIDKNKDIYILVNSSNDISGATQSSIYYSNDKGSTLKLLTNIENESISKIKIIDQKIYLLGKDGFLGLSIDNGETWKWIDSKIGKSFIDIEKSKYGELLAIAGWKDPILVLSKDEGKNWEEVNKLKTNYYHIRKNKDKLYLIGTSNQILELVK